MVISSSLHLSIYCIKNRTPFATIDYNPKFNQLESKYQSLLKDFSMLDRYIDATTGKPNDLLYRLKKCEDKPKSNVERKIKNLQRKGKRYIEGLKNKI